MAFLAPLGEIALQTVAPVVIESLLGGLMGGMQRPRRMRGAQSTPQMGMGGAKLTKIRRQFTAMLSRAKKGKLTKKDLEVLHFFTAKVMQTRNGRAVMKKAMIRSARHGGQRGRGQRGGMGGIIGTLLSPFVALGSAIAGMFGA